MIVSDIERKMPKDLSQKCVGKYIFVKAFIFIKVFIFKFLQANFSASKA